MLITMRITVSIMRKLPKIRRTAFVSLVFLNFCFSPLGLFAAEKKSSLVKSFVKGNISEKTIAVRNAEGEDKNTLSEMGLDFVIANAEILGDDRDLSTLGVASVLALEKDLKNDSLRQKLISSFKKFPDANMRTAILERLPDYAESEKSKKEI